jgi:inositol-phosphate phosphatase/L-galactose 1-phosphate phosphatase/histidinol-phosphatase
MLKLVDTQVIDTCPSEFIDFSHEVADTVGRVHRRNFRKYFSIEIKPDGSPVTQVDKESEQLVRQMIMEKFPDHGVIGEEFAPHQADADFVWVVDPLDGTQLFIMGRPLFGLLLALAYRGRFILGLIDHPVLRERWLGADGHGTRFNDAQVNTRTCSLLGHASLVRPGRNASIPELDDAIDDIAELSRWVQWGVTPYDYGLLASGHIDLLLSAQPKLHDVAPLDPIVRNAGGVASDWRGNPITLNYDGSLILCGDASLHAQALPSLQHRYASASFPSPVC